MAATPFILTRPSALTACGLFDELSPQLYEDVAELAGALFDVPMAYVSLIEGGRQWFKASVGMDAAENRDPNTFCAQVARSGQTIAVPDTLLDPQFRENPFVTGEPHVRFYVGAPILAPDEKTVLGTVCVVDVEPHAIRPGQVRALETLARRIVANVLQRQTTAATEAAAAKARENATKLTLATEAAKLGIYSWEPDTDTISWENELIYRILGRTREQGPVTAALFVAEVAHPDDVESFQRALSETVDGGAPFYWQGRVGRGDAERWVEFTGRLVAATAQTPRRLLGTVGDITEARAAHAVLRLAEERLRLGQASAGIVTWDWDRVTDSLVWSENVAIVFGRPAAELKYIDRAFECIVPEDRATVEAQIASADRDGAEFRVEFRVLWPDGSVHWLSGRGVAFAGADGRIVRLLGVNLDITASVLARQRLQESQERMQLAQAAARIDAWEWDLPTGRLTWMSEESTAYGRPTAELPDLPAVLGCVHPEDRELVMAEARAQLDRAGHFEAEFRNVWSDGTTHWAYAMARVVQAADGKAVCVVGVNSDITERKLAEKALIQNEKLAAVGRMASSIAHEINNPLEAVTNLLYIASHSEDVSHIRELLKTADDELRRVAAITNQTLRFHRQATRPTLVTCNELIGGTLTMHTSRLHNANVTVEKRKRAHRPVLCFEGEIRQVMSNLIGNAVDAMQGRGSGRLLLRSREGCDWKTGRPGLYLTVADDGPGMPPETQAKIFDAFFTTKGIGGTGLGLWISSDIVHRHKGKLRVRSSRTPGRSGTVFTLFLPFDAVSR